MSSTTFLIPNTLNRRDAAATFKVTQLNVVKGISQYDRRSNPYAKEREYAFVKFDLSTDLRPLFNWNTKQVFVSLVADYSTPSYVSSFFLKRELRDTDLDFQPENSVVLWDRILTSSRHARINLQDARQKYEYKTREPSFG